MLNSSQVQEVVNATPSDIVLTSTSQLSLVDSTLNLGGIGVLQITANSVTKLDRSGIRKCQHHPEQCGADLPRMIHRISISTD